jgi:hypothetical protein
LGNVLRYEEHAHIRSGLTALVIKDISMELEDFKGLEYFFYAAEDMPDDPAVQHVGSFPLVEIKK